MSPLLPWSSKAGVQTFQVVQRSGVFGKGGHKRASSRGGSTSEKLTKILGDLG